MNKPKIKIKLDAIDWILEIVGLLFLVLLVVFPLYYFRELPDTIPTHFNAKGNPNDFSQKNIIWTLPIIGFVLYTGMLLLNKIPHRFNYLKKITEENAFRQYRIATKLLRTLRVIIVVSFFYIAYVSIQTALNKCDGLGRYFLPIFLIATFGTIGVFLFQTLRKNCAK